MKSIDSLNFVYSRENEGIGISIPEFDDLEDHVGILSRYEANKLSAYMAWFCDGGIWMSYPNDPLNEDVVVERNGGEDGEYRWSGLTHYLIEKYRVDPPMEFRNHVKEQLASGIDLEALAKELWKMSKRRSPALVREREWRRLRAEGGVSAAWALYP